MVIGSGPIVIGQAAEFDYAGSQACRALKEEGYEVVLINSNPATIMTDLEMADRIYIEPLTLEFCEEVIRLESPDGLLASLGGQTGLNLATQLSDEGILDKYGVRLLGTPLEAIRKAEDREAFRDLMKQINEPVPESWVVTSEAELRALQDIVPYPVIIRPAYTLGGTGGGIAHNKEELLDIGRRGLALSLKSQILVEKSLLGWKEIEYEVMRDSADNCITICNMENVDPMGIHTGDSIVVAPSQTLSDIEYHLLRTASLRIIRALGIEGGCNIQLAVNPHSFDYYVIEVNPRVSRSSALASKATGYPIARVSAKVAVGKTLDQIENAVTKTTTACFEPALDYCVVKIPRWPFDKFPHADRTLHTQMKSTGEAMAIDRNFEGALLKAIKGLDIHVKDLYDEQMASLSENDLERLIRIPTDQRLWAIAEAFRRGWTVDQIHEWSRIDPWFLVRIQSISGKRETPKPRAFKIVDTCAAEFESRTPYYYSTTEEASDLIPTDDRPSVLVLGSGPIRIGQGIEFDYSSVHCVWALREMGYRAAIINNNPETVSTDFDTADALYFEPVTLEHVLHVIQAENAIGAIVQFGGQTSINLAEDLAKAGVKILGTSWESIHLAEDRDALEKLLHRLNIPKPPGKGVTTLQDALHVANQIGYPVLVRPSFVLGGRAMEIVYSDKDLKEYLQATTLLPTRGPILVDKYLEGTEAELDVISDGEDTLIPGIMEHIERAGIHSGDSMTVYPPVTIPPDQQAQMVRSALQLARELNIKGLMNIQFVIHNGIAYVLEVNPRASRTVPYLSKVTNLPMVRIATRCAMGETLRLQGYSTGIWDPTEERVVPFGSDPRYTAPPHPGLYAVKAPVFSFQKLTRVEPALGPEMKSTGEVLGIDRDYGTALYKAILASGVKLPPKGTVIITVRDQDKPLVLPIARTLLALGYEIASTRGTAEALRRAGIPSRVLSKISETHPRGCEKEKSILDEVESGHVALLINTPSHDRQAEAEARQIRLACVQRGISCLTSIDTAQALLLALQAKHERPIHCQSLNDYFALTRRV
jgi:carbamoyl-phosphate synthase large subunit